ncbi:MAG: metallophosphoesterase [Candidatus Thiodiazotropha sp.]
MAQSGLKTRKSLLKRLRKLFSGLEQCDSVDLQQAYHLADQKVRVSLPGYPLQLNLPGSGKALQLYPECLSQVVDSSCHSRAYVLFDGDRYFREISGFCRLEDGDKIMIHDAHPLKECLGATPQGDAQPLMTIRNDRGDLIFRDLTPQQGSCLSPLLEEKSHTRISHWRRSKLKHLRQFFGGKIAPLPSPQALDLLTRVNQRMAHEIGRAADSEGRPGGLLRLPDNLIPIIVGDLHGRVDNLLTLLSHNGFMEGLESGEACLLILGDAVHSESEGRYHEMQSSILMMDLILQLKDRFPDRVFYLRGNHDGFSDDIAKGGVAQGLLWKKALNKARGKAYRKEMERFYENLPLLACSSQMICCHAAPPTSRTELASLVDIRNHPNLIGELTRNRLQTPARPGGYTRGDVKRLRKLLSTDADTPVIVGHTPLSVDDTLWQDVGQIENHYVVYGGHSEWIGVMTRIDGRMAPLIYPAEPLQDYLNQVSD